MTREHGQSARTYKSALFWIVPESSTQLREEARKLIAWEDIKDEELALDEPQRKQLNTSVERSRLDLTESVWRTYKNVMCLNRENQIETMDLGLVTSSAADSLTKFILSTLRQKDIVAKEVPPRYLVRHWPPAFTEWNTRSVRDAFFSSPQFPRLLDPDTIQETIARGVSEKLIAYVGKSAGGGYDPFLYGKPLRAQDVEISDDMFIMTSEESEKILEPPKLNQLNLTPSDISIKFSEKQFFTVSGTDQYGNEIQTGAVTWSATGGEIDISGVFTAGSDQGNFLVTAEAQGVAATVGVHVSKDVTPPPSKQSLTWTGDVAPTKWTNLYMKVLTKLVNRGEIKITVSVEATPKDGVSDQLREEIKTALRGLSLDDDVQTG